jgi:trimethylamine--corrinoid protein Co-methyltransferase
MNHSDLIRPTIHVLDQGQRESIHARSLQILSFVGVRVDSPRARQLFARAIDERGVGATTSTWEEGERVMIPPELVEWALGVAPPMVQIYDRRGDPAYSLGYDPSTGVNGDGQTRFGIGVTALYYQDALTDDVTPFTRRHMARMVRLGGALDSFDLVTTIGIVQDVPPQLSDLYATLEMAANTTKPLGILISEEERFPDTLELLAHVHGDLASKPFVIPYFNPISPLVINAGTADKMFATVERGLPFMYSNYGMAGATTPITPAATLVLLNAELLAGLTLSQLMKEGTPVILGSLPAFFDMKGMGSFYDMHSYIIDLACAEMMAYYGLPHCGTSGSGMGWGADLIAAGHQWANHLLSCLGKVGLAPFVGDNLDSKAISPTIIVYANEVIAQARRLAQGFPLDEASVSLDEIGDIGPGGNYLTAPSTLRGFRRAYYDSAVWPKLTLEDWEARGKPRAERFLRDHTRHLLESAPPPQDRDELLSKGEAFIRQLAGD